MAKKITLLYRCSACNETFPRWIGRCTSCDSWNTVQESSLHPLTGSSRPLENLSALSCVEPERASTAIPDLDMLLGGGLLPGSLVLIGGEPGVGKSTLLLEIARSFAGKFIYFSGEESPAQIKMRAGRMEVSGERLLLSRETRIDSILETILAQRPDLVAVDSMQTIAGSHSAGSVSQMKEAALSLMELCKAEMIPVIVTGHITREGSIAGPKMLEHMVDVVLSFETDRLNHYRILRAMKNRFGPVGEVAIFEMATKGLKALRSVEIARSKTPQSGRTFSAYQEGSRSIAAEVQALVIRTAPGLARRTAEGLDTRRVVLLSAVMEKYLKLNLGACDIFANLAGGMSADDPALDLAICAAVLSSFHERPLDSMTAYIGEVGLSGEVRPAGRINERLRELSGLGFQKAVLSQPLRLEVENSPLELRYVSNIREILN